MTTLLSESVGTHSQTIHSASYLAISCITIFHTKMLGIIEYDDP